MPISHISCLPRSKVQSSDYKVSVSGNIESSGTSPETIRPIEHLSIIKLPCTTYNYGFKSIIFDDRPLGAEVAQLKVRLTQIMKYPKCNRDKETRNYSGHYSGNKIYKHAQIIKSAG